MERRDFSTAVVRMAASQPTFKTKDAAHQILELADEQLTDNKIQTQIELLSLINQTGRLQVITRSCKSSLLKRHRRYKKIVALLRSPDQNRGPRTGE